VGRAYPAHYASTDDLMDRATFEAVVSGFWQHLGLSGLVFASEPEIVLSVDAIDVVLRHGADGKTLVIEVQAGILTRQANLERAQMERLLKTNFALCAMRRTLGVLDDEGSERPRVAVRGFYRYRQNDLSGLADLVSDVISSAETLEQVLTVSQKTDMQLMARTDLLGPRDEEFVILRP